MGAKFSQVHAFAARAFMMMAQGIRTIDAIEWVIRRLHSNLKSYWRRLLLGELLAALA